MNSLLRRATIAAFVFCCASSLAYAGDNSDVEAGRAEAKKELAAHKLGYRQPIPETFILEWEEGDDKNLLDYDRALLADRYGITLAVVMFHAGTPLEERRRAAGYDEEMTHVIEKRFGADVVDRTWHEVCDASPAQREHYLKHRRELAAAQRRRPATQPTTRESTASTQPAGKG